MENKYLGLESEEELEELSATEADAAGGLIILPTLAISAFITASICPSGSCTNSCK